MRKQYFVVTTTSYDDKFYFPLVTEALLPGCFVELFSFFAFCILNSSFFVLFLLWLLLCRKSNAPGRLIRRVWKTSGHTLPSLKPNVQSSETTLFIISFIKSSMWIELCQENKHLQKRFNKDIGNKGLLENPFEIVPQLLMMTSYLFLAACIEVRVATLLSMLYFLRSLLKLNKKDG